MSNEQLARFGRWSIWILLVYVAGEGVLGHYFDPNHYKIMVFFGPEYADHDASMDQALPLNNLAHRFLGLTLLTLGALQFNTDLRQRKPQVHRWIGRSYLFLSIITLVSGLVFAMKTPFVGQPEKLFVTLVTLSLLFMLSRAWMMVRRRDFVHHREWMIRGYALFMFIAVQRFLVIPFLPFNWVEHERFMFTAWLAIAATMVSAETWINLTRRQAPTTQGINA